MNPIPEIIIPSSLNLPPQAQTTADNGIKLHTISVRSSSVVRLTLVLEGGSSVQQHPFAAASTLSMLSEGTADYTAAQIAEHLDYYGIFFDNETDRDYCYLTVASLTKFLPQALAMIESVLLRPTFSDKEFELYKGKKRQQIILDRQKPSFIARENFAAQLFGADHPYGRTFGIDSFDALTIDHIRSHYNDSLRSAPMFAVASGDLGEEQIALITDFLNKIPTRATAATRNFAQPVSSADNRQNIERENSTQSCIRMGKLLFTKQHPHYIPMQLLLTVLGGYFGSRLVQNLRQKNGYTYGAYSAMVTLRHSGYIAVATDVAREHTEEAINEIFAEINRLRTELIDADELEMAKSSITGELMRLIDGPFGIADIAIENIQSALPPTYLNEFLCAILATTAEDLQQLAIKHLDPTTLRLTVVG